MKSPVLHTVWCNISGDAAEEIWNWSLSGVKGLTRSRNFTQNYKATLSLSRSRGWRGSFRGVEDWDRVTNRETWIGESRSEAPPFLHQEWFPSIAGYFRHCCTLHYNQHYSEDRPFYSCVLCDQAFWAKRGLGWLYLCCFQMSIAICLS